MSRSKSGLRYRAIETSLQADADYVGLSDSAALAYLTLRTGRHTTNLPGLWRAWLEELARPRWTPQVFKKLFAEIEERGMAQADWNAGVVFVPRVLLVNAPANPDAILAWKSSWVEIPDCPLKRRAHQLFYEHCVERDAVGSVKSYVDSFLEACGEPIPTDHGAWHSGAHGGSHGDEPRRGHCADHSGGDATGHGAHQQEQEAGSRNRKQEKERRGIAGFAAIADVVEGLRVAGGTQR